MTGSQDASSPEEHQRTSLSKTISNFVTNPLRRRRRKRSARRRVRHKPADVDVTSLRAIMNADPDPAHGRLREKYEAFLTDYKLGQFLVAMKMKEGDAATKLFQHLQWREEFKADDIIHEGFEELKARREMYWGGHDKDGAPSLVFRFRNHDVKQPSESFAREMVFMLETGQHALQFTKINILLDARDASRSQFSADLVKTLVGTLQHNYPETVKRIVIFPIGYLERMVINLVRMLIDPVTAAKMHVLVQSDFVAGLAAMFNPDQLEECDGGTVAQFPHLDIEAEKRKRKAKMQLRKEVKEVFAKFAKENGRDPSDAELAALCAPLYAKAKQLDKGVP